jgi:hypothetical protein
MGAFKVAQRPRDLEPEFVEAAKRNAGRLIGRRFWISAHGRIRPDSQRSSQRIHVMMAEF